MSSTGKRRPFSQSIIIFTASEFGQANINLALLYELLRDNDGFDIHIASHQRLKSRVDSVAKGLPRRPTFHVIPVPTFEELHERSSKEMTHAPGMGAVIGYRRCHDYQAGYAPSEYATTYNACVKILQDVRPVCAVLDMLFPMPYDACQTEFVPTIRMSPILLYHSVPYDQPWMGMLWKYPFVGTGLPFPIPWSHIPQNIYLTFQMLRLFPFRTHRSDLNKFRQKSLGLKDATFPNFVNPSTSFPCLSASLPELDFPLDVVPEYVKACGPMVLPTKPVREEDPELASWLEGAKGGTVLVQMGTHWERSFTEDNYVKNIAAMAQGIRILLDHVRGVQVLWKCKLPEPDPDAKTSPNPDKDPLHSLLNTHASRIRITPWLAPSPSSLLLDPSISSRILAVVHHGGASSFHESAVAGVPQVILPVWYDTYDVATRAAYLGIGVWANRGVAPNVDGEELGRALLDVVVGGEAGMKEKVKEKERAAELGRRMRRDEEDGGDDGWGKGEGRGRRRAAGEVLRIAREEMERER